MTEQVRPTDIYGDLSPVERNTRLVSLYRMLPRGPRSLEEVWHLREEERLDTIEGLDTVMQRILTQPNEYRETFLARVEELLDHAFITEAFREQILVWGFGRFIDWGVDSGKPNSVSDNYFRLMLDFGNGGSPGIFDPDRARQLEAESFRKYRKSRDYIEFRYSDWRLEYWKKYGKDPRIDLMKPHLRLQPSN